MLLSVKCRNDEWHNNEFFTVDINHLCITHCCIEGGEVRTAEQFEMPTGSEFSEPLIMAFETNYDAEMGVKNACAFSNSLNETTRLQSIYVATTYEEFVNLWNDKLRHTCDEWYFIYYGAKCLVSGTVEPYDLEEIKPFLNKIRNANIGF